MQEVKKPFRKKNKNQSPSRCKRGGGGRTGPRGTYPFEMRLRAVKLHLEEGFPVDLVAEETGISVFSIRKWVNRYRDEGEAGLKTKRRKNGKKATSDAVKSKITDIKKENPEFGKKRISQILRRIFFLQASPTTVQKTIKEEGLQNPPPRKKPKRNPASPRFFERSRPNQLWQTDIFTFRLGGRNAYLIGYVDDYSRYMVGMELFRSQTAEHVIEVYRQAIAEYGVPREMLTDNGRQYTNWRGTSRFEKELQKDRIHHIKSAPHHPMTLGKIERFWKTIFQEFLCRAQFDSFDQARERVRMWIRYYNHKRPHQGIKGLCPADRFFEIQTELKKVMEKGIEDNILEIALRGKPTDPFYMVGRMGDQSVVIRAEKGKVRMILDEPDGTEKEIVYDMEKEKKDERENETNQEPQAVYGNGEGTGSAIDMGGEEETGRDLPGNGHPVGAPEQLAEPGSGGYAGGAGGEEREGEGTSPRRQAPEAAGPADGGQRAPSQPAAAAVREDPAGQGDTFCNEEVRQVEYEAGQGRAEAGVDHEGQKRPYDGDGSGQEVGSIPQNVLPVGEEGAIGNDGSADGETDWPEGEKSGLREGDAEAGVGEDQGEEYPAEEHDAAPGTAEREPTGPMVVELYRQPH